MSLTVPLSALRWRSVPLLGVWALVLTSACSGGGSGATPVASSGSVEFTGCQIAVGAAGCSGTISWQVSNAMSPQLSMDDTVLSAQPSGTVAVTLPGDFVDIVLTDGPVVLDSVTLRGVCETASAWDGTACATFAVRLDERASTPFFEQGAAVELEVVIFKPEGPGPFPTVMFNHGSTGNGSDPSLFSTTVISETVAKFFTDRGWLVAFPQRRGRGQSDGLYDEGFNASRTAYSCDQDIALNGAGRALDDLDAAADWLRNRADVDTTRMVVAGTSRGGILAIRTLAQRPDVYLGAINFVGGWLGEGCGDFAEVNRSLFVTGAVFPDDTLWLYANNDSFYSVEYSRANFDAFTAAGGLGTFNVYTREPGLDGHFLINSPDLWGPVTDGYLSELP